MIGLDLRFLPGRPRRVALAVVITPALALALAPAAFVADAPFFLQDADLLRRDLLRCLVLTMFSFRSLSGAYMGYPTIKKGGKGAKR